MEVKFCTSSSVDLFGCNSKSLRSSFYYRISRSFKLRVKIMESSASTSHEKEYKKTTIKPSYKQALLSTPGKWLPKTMIRPSYKQALLSTPEKWLPKTMIRPSYKQALLSTPEKWLPKTMIRPSYMQALLSTPEKWLPKTMIRPSYMQALLSTPEKWLPKTMIRPSYKQALLSTPGKWLPTDDGIVVISERSKDMEGEVTVKEKLDKYMDRALYGRKESSLPVFKRLCRE